MVSIDRPLRQIEDMGQLLSTLGSILSDLEDQLNASTFVFARNDATVPAGTRKNDVVINADQASGNITIQVSNGKTFTSVLIPNNILDITQNYKGFTSQASPPSVTELPNDGDWGFFTNTAIPASYIARNFSGTIKKATMT